MNTRVLALLIAAISGLWVATAVAQPPDRGPRGPGGRRAEMLRRMDANEDGILQTAEIPERARPVLRAAAERAGLNPDQPMPIDQLTPPDERRGEGEGEGGRRDRRGRRGDDRDREDDRGGRRRGGRWRRGDDDEDRPRYKPNNDPTTVRGFGEPLSHPPVPGFDVSLAVATASMSDADLEAVYTRRVVQFVDEGILGRYDKNKNKVLDPDEWEAVGWRTDPNDSDTNKDGRLTREELMNRMAKRFGVEPQPIKSDDSTTAESSSTKSQSKTREPAKVQKKVSESARVRDWVRGVFEEHDQNRDNILDESELENAGGLTKKADINKDGRVTRAELLTFNSPKSDKAGNRTSQSSSRSSSYGRTTSSDQENAKRAAARERLTGGLPSWFHERDADRDGQVGMHEYSIRWSESKVAEFKRYDPNGDGLITPAEAQGGRSR